MHNTHSPIEAPVRIEAKCVTHCSACPWRVLALQLLLLGVDVFRAAGAHAISSNQKKTKKTQHPPGIDHTGIE